MAKTLQFRRGTTSEISAITGAVGELFVDTTKDTVVVMDGSTAGGFPLARESALAAKADASALTSGLSSKQDTLVSGTNIKTINGTSVLGSGDITISGGGGSTPTDVLAVQMFDDGSAPNYTLYFYQQSWATQFVTANPSNFTITTSSTSRKFSGGTIGAVVPSGPYWGVTVTSASESAGTVAYTSGTFVTYATPGAGISSIDGATATTLTIGDIYYANNILTPIPTVSTTSYGTVTNYPPVVVNSTLNVLSSDASASILFTLSGADLSGGQSGGTNNFGTVNSGNSNVAAKGQVKFTIQKPSDNCITVFKQLRQGDVITTVATNGFYTGTVSMTLASLQLGKQRDVGGPYGPDIGEHGFIQIIGQLTDVNNAPVGSNLNFNANIITVTRPYNASVVAGGLKPTYLDSPQVAADNVIVNKKLDVYEAAYLGATYSRTQGTYHAVGQFFGGQNIQIEGYKTDFMYISVTGTNSYPIEFGWDMRDPISEGYSRTITIMMTADSNFSLTLAHGGANTVVAGADPDHTSYTYYYVPTFWKDNSYPSQVTAGRTLEMKFKFVANGESGFSGLFCEWKEYY